MFGITFINVKYEKLVIIHTKPLETNNFFRGLTFVKHNLLINFTALRFTYTKEK